MKIISLTAENVKKLVAVQIKPDGNVVQITGRNGQGKTSVLDSIWWCLGGSKPIQAQPIRKGQSRGKIVLDLGEYVVTRTFERREGNDYTTQLSVRGADGQRFSAGQTLVDSFLGSLTFDPLEFSRLDAKKQFDALRQFVPDVDFQKIDNLNEGDGERRTEVNRLAKQARAAADMITVPDGTPAESIDITALVTRLQEAGDSNAEIERRQANRTRNAERVAEMRKAASAHLAGIEAACDAVTAASTADVDELRKQIADLEERIKQRSLRADREAHHARVEREALADQSTQAADSLQALIDAAEELPAIVDTVALAAEIEKARATNKAVDRAAERAKHESTASRYEAEAKALTESIDARNAAKRKAIAAAKMPVPGLDFGDGVVLLNGVPFDQASDAQRLQTSVAIAMAANPKLRVIRIRDGSLLDEDAMKLLGQMADEQDMQVWVERVDSSGSVGFVLEDGHLKTATEGEAA
jgi:DNA repair exonuclease SbcCD ATPase subunit